MKASTVWGLVVAVVAGYFLFGGSSSASSGDGAIIDGLAFPASLRMASVDQQLTGGGTRTKYGVAKVYAVALYIGPGADSVLKKFAGAKPPTNQPKFFSALVEGPFARTLALQFHRSVTPEAMANALDEAMAKRLPADDVAKFREALLKALGTGAIAKGAKLYLMCKAQTLSIGSGSTSVSASLKIKGVCPALFDIYYGKQPVSPAAKDGAALGFASRFYQ